MEDHHSTLPPLLLEVTPVLADLSFQQQSMIFLSKMEIGYLKKKKKAVVSVAAPLVEVLNEVKGVPSRTAATKRGRLHCPLALIEQLRRDKDKVCSQFLPLLRTGFGSP